MSRPFWIGDKLLLARRVQIGEATLVQGGWLDWPRIRARLLAESADLLPAGAELVPVCAESQVHPGRILATLPVEVVVPAPAAADGDGSTIRLALTVAWACLLTTLLAIGGLLWGVVALSERRAAFVAAVTHELRTPLTTFRLYSEMLASGMTPPERRQEYVATLHTEAERLTHLVENVLSYARLERGRRAPRVRIGLSELLAQWTPRLADRALQARLELVSDANHEATQAAVATDPQAVGQILFNLVDNASKYASQVQRRRIELSCRVEAKTARIRVRDYGPGLSPAQRRKLFQPFSKSVEEAAVTAPGVGLGLAALPPLGPRPRRPPGIRTLNRRRRQLRAGTPRRRELAIPSAGGNAVTNICVAELQRVCERLFPATIAAFVRTADREHESH